MYGRHRFRWHERHRRWLDATNSHCRHGIDGSHATSATALLMHCFPHGPSSRPGSLTAVFRSGARRWATGASTCGRRGCRPRSSPRPTRPTTSPAAAGAPRALGYSTSPSRTASSTSGTCWTGAPSLPPLCPGDLCAYVSLHMAEPLSAS